MTAEIKYRPDIDGLRAVAVLAVVLYHARVPLVSGGYVGVDVFFVISGYLITSIIRRQIEAGRFSVRDFYERRIRRIFPALAVVLAATTVGAVRLMLPDDLVDYGRSLASVLVFSSNLLFWKSAGYFDGPSETKPLLHTWSLAVEEQFYLLFPIVLFLLYRWRRGWVGPILLAAFSVSLATSAFGTFFRPTWTFFLPPFRAWELLFGALLVTLPLPRLQPGRRLDLLAALGLLLVFAPIVLYRPETRFPGLAAVPPTLGATLLIYCGENGRTWAGRLLSLRPFVLVGLISYSLYLWHWPVIVLAEYANIDTLTPAQLAGAVVASILLSIASYRWIEQPCRRRMRRRWVFGGAFAGSAALGAAALAIMAADGLPQRFSPAVLEIAAARQTDNPRTFECFRSNLPPEQSCVYGAAVPPSWALWGDSHADAVIASIARVAERNGQAIRLLARSGCPPVMGVWSRAGGASCAAFSDQAMKYLLAESGIRDVILLARFGVYVEGYSHTIGRLERRDDAVLAVDRARSIRDEAERRRLYAGQLARTVQTLMAAGKRVHLVYPMPEAGFDVPATIARRLAAGKGADDLRIPAEAYRLRTAFLMPALDAIPDAPQFNRLRTFQGFCDGDGCAIQQNGHPLFYDDDHPSAFAASQLGAALEAHFAAARGGR